MSRTIPDPGFADDDGAGTVLSRVARDHGVDANVIYASESDPSLGGSALYKEAVMGSTPTLATGTMVQLALIGLAFVFRHPRLRGTDREEDNFKNED